MINKSFKLYTTYQIPKTGTLAINIRKIDHIQKWADLQKVFASNLDQFNNIFNTRENRSFNRAVVRDFFREDIVKIAYLKIVDLLFMDPDPESLCKRIKLDCCRGKHSEECAKKWVDLKIYLQEEYLADIEIAKGRYSENEFVDTLLLQ